MSNLVEHVVFFLKYNISVPVSCFCAPCARFDT
jgi:hypothetical protein